MFKRILASLALSIIAISPAFAANPVVDMQTNQGDIRIELYPDKAPATVANFIRYVKDGFYNGLVFHRVIDGFMIQGGGFDRQMHEKQTRAPIRNEANNGLKNLAGTIAMARTNDPNSATAQFFINLVDNGSLDYPSFDGWGYAVFGKVIKGFDVVQTIGKVATHDVGPYQNVPLTPVVIQSATLLAPGAGQ